MKTLAIATGLAASLCGGLAAAQNPSTPSTQTPSPQPPTASSPATRPAPNTAANRNVMVTMTGCLYNEGSVPGRTPNVAEKAGVLEDYILAEARLSNSTAADHSGASPGTATSTGNNTATRGGSEGTRATGNSTTSTEGQTSTSQAGASSAGADRGVDATRRAQGSTAPTTQVLTAGTMYKVEGVPDEQLRALVGKRVEVMGRIDAEGNTSGARPNRNPVSPDKVDLPEFEASSIRAASGGASCAATPSVAPVPPR